MPTGMPLSENPAGTIAAVPSRRLPPFPPTADHLFWPRLWRNFGSRARTLLPFSIAFSSDSSVLRLLRRDAAVLVGLSSDMNVVRAAKSRSWEWMDDFPSRSRHVRAGAPGVRTSTVIASWRFAVGHRRGDLAILRTWAVSCHHHVDAVGQILPEAPTPSDFGLPPPAVPRARLTRHPRHLPRRTCRVDQHGIDGSAVRRNSLVSVLPSISIISFATAPLAAAVSHRPFRSLVGTKVGDERV